MDCCPLKTKENPPIFRAAATPIWAWLKIREHGVTQVVVHVSTDQSSMLIPVF